MNAKSIHIQKSARYELLGDPKAKKMLFVLHGYGQLSEYFIKNFESLVNQDYFIVAPEGTHRFYLEGSSGRVGASWMTKELRLNDIDENFSYLEQLLSYLTSVNKYESISILGFSQGGATASRWFAKSQFKFEKLILWACVFPEDLQGEFFSEKFKQSSKYFVLGEQDEYFSTQDFEKANEFYRLQDFQVINFKGKHKIDSNTLLLLFDQKE